jgi:hypothetical protein
MTAPGSQQRHQKNRDTLTGIIGIAGAGAPSPCAQFAVIGLRSSKKKITMY